MNKSIKIIGLLGLLTSVLSACENKKSYSPEDYILEMPYKENFQILQLNDIHFGNKDDQSLHLKFLDLTISEKDFDLIVLCGDLFTFADKATAYRLFDFIDSYDIPWTVVFGNHDEQCYFSIEWLTGYLNSLTTGEERSSNCLFKDILDDDVFGHCNFVINLVDESNQVQRQVYCLDSNRYYYGTYFGYDYIHDDQIEWYKNMVDYSTSTYGHIIPSIAFFHIPVPEFQDAWDAYLNGDSKAEYYMGELNEPVSCAKINSNFFDVVKEKGSTKALICAHDHVNNFTIKYEGIYLSYGINSTNIIYSQDGMMGGQLITLTDSDITFEHIIHWYSEVQ